MALTGLSSVNGTTSAIEDKGLRDFISTASGSWTGGGTSGPVTSTGGTSTYINKLNNMNLSASVAYASPNGALLDNVYNSGRSGYAASAYISTNISAMYHNYTHYYQYGMSNWWNSTASNPLCIKINTANFCTAGTVSDAHLFLLQLGGPESGYTATMFIKDFKTNLQWATASIATFGGGVHDESNTVQPQFLMWNSNIVCNAKHGGWDQTLSGIFLGGTWTATGQDLMLNLTGIVSK